MSLQEELDSTNNSLLGFKENVAASPIQEDEGQKSSIVSKPQTIKPICTPIPDSSYLNYPHCLQMRTGKKDYILFNRIYFKKC